MPSEEETIVLRGATGDWYNICAIKRKTNGSTDRLKEFCAYPIHWRKKNFYNLTTQSCMSGP